MQGTRTFDRKRLIIFIILPAVLLAALIVLDQITKFYAAQDKVNSTVIENFFYLDYSTNSGAGFSLFADKEWGQLLFKIITPVALIGFFAFYFFALKKSYKWLAYSITLIISGTIGNFIDRIINSEVVDFLSFHFWSYRFPTFNVADVCLTVGVIMLIAHFFFFDENAIVKKKSDKENAVNDDNTESADIGDTETESSETDVNKDENL